MFKIVLWLPKLIFLAHYVVFVNLTTPHKRLHTAEQRIALMHLRLFGDVDK